MGYSPWDHRVRESDTTQRLTLYFFSCKGLRNVHGDDHSINRGKYSNFSQKKQKNKNKKPPRYLHHDSALVNRKATGGDIKQPSDHIDTNSSNNLKKNRDSSSEQHQTLLRRQCVSLDLKDEQRESHVHGAGGTGKGGIDRGRPPAKSQHSDG